MADTIEVNFEGIVGQTHNYSGLSYGNVASMENKNISSSPKKAALQGLEKMKFLHDLGLRLGVIPPHERPHIPTLRTLGFSGPSRLIPEKVYKKEPLILFNYSSASPMWAANSATFTPSIDSYDEKVHITPANLAATQHRTIEAVDTARVLKRIFPSTAYFSHHPPLPFGTIFTDEGSANHLRFCQDYHDRGVHLFVYGKQQLDPGTARPTRFPARQTLEASEAIARAHKIFPERVLFAQQSSEAIDMGVFHNDVISVSDRNMLFYHERAFEDDVIAQVRDKVEKLCETEMLMIEVTDAEVPLSVAVKTYLFNSQLVTLPDKPYVLIAPDECHINKIVYDYLEKLIYDPDCPLRDVHYVELDESMRNGGGPGCLRTRVVLNENELAAVNQKCLFNERLYEKLKGWIEKHYRDHLSPEDLQDPHLVDEVQAALEELTQILDLGSIYSFQ